MSGMDDEGAPPEIPEEYADTYRAAYLRALAEEPAAAAPLAPADLPLVDEGDGAKHWSASSWLVVLAVVVLLVAAAFGLGRLLSDDDAPATGGAKKPAASHRASPTQQASHEPSQPPVAGAWKGEVVPVVITSATASCTAPPGVDSSGRKVDYDVANSIDDDSTTAWRCDGRAIGQRLTVVLPPGTEVGEVGLIPGYAKDDPETGADRYVENNRITRVRWTLADGVDVVQRLDPDPKDRQLQTIRVPRTATGSITLEILAVQRGPRNTTAISSIGIGSAT